MKKKTQPKSNFAERKHFKYGMSEKAAGKSVHKVYAKPKIDKRKLAKLLEKPHNRNIFAMGVAAGAVAAGYYAEK